MELASEILSDITVHMKYARYVADKYRRETYEELVDRNKAMHIKKFPKMKEEIEAALAEDEELEEEKVWIGKAHDRKFLTKHLDFRSAQRPLRWRAQTRDPETTDEIRPHEP